MNQDTKTLKDDISYMRRLAEQGSNGPILGGTFLAAAGVVFGGTCFVQWYVSAHRLMPDNRLTYLWGGAFAVFAAIWLALFYRLRRTPGLRPSVPNAVFGTVWTSCAVGITVAAVCAGITARVAGAPQVMMLVAPLVFSFYGVAWSVSAALARRSWMILVGAAAFLAAIVLALLAGTPWQLPGMGMALLATLSVPGFRMMTEESVR